MCCVCVVRRDHVFFFSYVQPKQKGGVGGMWREADELAEVNGMSLLICSLSHGGVYADLLVKARLSRNFMNGLKLANLKPKRVLLQSGAKHYGQLLEHPREIYVDGVDRIPYRSSEQSVF